MSMADTLDVPEDLPPLADRTLVVTRPASQAAELAEALEALGARALLFPTIEIRPPSDLGPLEAVARGASDYDWVIFTSANGVLAFHEASKRMGLEISRSVGASRVCCIGPTTARAAEGTGLPVSLIPERYVAEAVVDALDATGQLQGQRILIPVAGGAREVLPRRLRQRGAIVDVVVAYETIPVGEVSVERLARLHDGVDLVMFASPSSVRGFHRLVKGRQVAPAAVIGPITASTARDLGYDVTVEAEDFTVTGLIEAVVCHYRDELQ